MAQISGGGFYQIPATVLQSFWSGLIGTFYSSSWLAFSSYSSCANITQYVTLGADSSTITFDIFGIDTPQINVLNSNGMRPEYLFIKSNIPCFQAPLLFRTSSMPAHTPLLINWESAERPVSTHYKSIQDRRQREANRVLSRCVVKVGSASSSRSHKTLESIMVSTPTKRHSLQSQEVRHLVPTGMSLSLIYS
jgi:hypothetical protein